MFLCLLCAISSSIDSLSVSISYGAKGVKLPNKTILLVSLISTSGTYLSMKFGQIILRITSENIVDYIGSFVLMALGIYFIYDTKTKDDISVKELINNPESLDYNNSGEIELNEAVFLAIILTINNIGVGIAVAIGGLNIYHTTIFTFMVTAFTLKVGESLGEKLLANKFGKYTQIISGVIIICMGVIKII